MKDRVKELRRVRADKLKANPKNWRTHPAGQRNALRGIVEDVGFAGAVLARELVGLERELNEARRKLKDAESAWEGARAKLEETQAKGREAELRLEQLHKETPG